MLASRASFWRKSVICLLARAAGRPYILHVHGGEMMQFYEDESSPAVQRFIRSIYSHASLVLALSEDWRRNLLRICPSMRVEVLHNAVALPDESRLRRLQTRAPAILALGDLRQRKGTYDLVRAFARIAASYPRLELVCAGNGETQAVRDLAEQLDVGARVSCPGYLRGEQKAAELAGATIFVLPSYAEGMPMALLEAMSWGLPVIASRVGGIPQLVEHEVTGLLIEPGDIDGLAAACQRLLDSPALQERLGRAARARVEERFSVDAALEQLSRIYRQFGIAELPIRGTLS
jgi:glycosyltransferase involved in cell wall biosynthesis